MADSESIKSPELLEKQQYCAGCRDDFYNHDGHAMNGAYCWSLPTAHIVARYRIGWWVPMDRAENFTEVITLDCHHAPGIYAHCKELPAHLRGKGGVS